MASKTNRGRVIALCAALVLLVTAFGVWWALDKSELAAGRKVSVVPVGADEARLLINDQGEVVYNIVWSDGTPQELSPSAYATLIEREFRERPIYMRVLNVSSPIGLFWIGVGLLAQMVFMARMLVQWVVSEKHKRSVVPPMFWWLSLAGASMLIVYFIWRQDIIGVLGQATGWVVYIRNIMLLSREKNTPLSALDPMDEEPALDSAAG